MPKAIKDMREVPLSPFEALKRYYINHGYIPRYIRKHAEVMEGDSDKSGQENPKNEQPASSSQSVLAQDEEKIAHQPQKTDQDLKTELSEEGEPESKKKSNAEQEQTKADPKMATSDKKLHEVTKHSQEVLYKATTVFPFALFPDTLTLDREKMTIAKRDFFRVATITSIPISEILSCEVSVGPFFGSLHFVFRFFADNEKSFYFFWRNEATELQRMIHGFIIAHRKEINTDEVPLEELKQMLIELGTGATD